MTAASHPPSDAELAERIARMICAMQPGASSVEVTDLRRLSGGNARRAWAFTAGWDVIGKRHRVHCVMLCKVGAGQLEADLGREFRTLAALSGRELPIPRTLWLDEAGVFLGVPGFVMERGEGVSDVLALLNPADPAITRTLVEHLLRIGAALHAADWRGADLDFLADGPVEDAPRRELQRWEDRFRQNRMEPHPILSSIFDWLHRHLPSPSHISVVHGDFRIGNFLYRERRIELLLDWEMVHLGDPLEDVAWIYRRLWSPEAFLPLPDAIAIYAAAAGRSVRATDLLYYRIFSEMKFAVISMTAARSYFDGRTENLRLAGRMFAVPECLERCLAWMDQWEAA
ncbi:phosphotransferase family protein [Vineibacter terrae]|uniref:phosphotransferase family protein n=1 Tax=Vineibacter terrae TaxID=2586908 RepID=UPI002E338713|nr:phosphotransferase family protein [Vineibacter terrae]HEX2884949.1 phosphotransferase family protein [Vineibacter terrae]